MIAASERADVVDRLAATGIPIVVVNLGRAHTDAYSRERFSATLSTPLTSERQRSPRSARWPHPLDTVEIIEMRPLVDLARLTIDDDPVAALDDDATPRVVDRALRRDKTRAVVLEARARERHAVVRYRDLARLVEG
jgi:hypothetical protein